VTFASELIRLRDCLKHQRRKNEYKCLDLNRRISHLRNGVVPVLVRLLAESSDEKLQFEASWALTNIASGTDQQTQAVLETPAVHVFLHLVLQGAPAVREQAIWALGNLAGNGESFDVSDGLLIHCCCAA
jgi:hypothetical protein